MAARNYSTDFKKTVLKHLRENGYNYYQTAKKFKVSKNTIKAWDDYPNNLPEEVKLKIELNHLKRTKGLKRKESIANSSPIIQQEIPQDIKGLEQYAIKAALTRGIMLLDYAGSSKEFSDIAKSLVSLIQIPEDRKKQTGASLSDLILKHLKEKQ